MPPDSAVSDRFSEVTAGLPLAGRRVFVAFSGGVDSTVLLHLLHRSGLPAELVAVHVDHRLHEDSAAWNAHCESVAVTLGIRFIAKRVEVQPAAGQSLEAEARDARYRALSESIGKDDVVVTAHHADDQLETILLRLLRGSGVRGMRAIHAVSPLGPGLLVRPFLDFTRREIESEARSSGLSWLEDPSNADTRFDRNFLRARILPELTERWPQAGTTATRLARQMADAESILAEVAAADLAVCEELDRIPVALLAALSDSRCDNALRHAIRFSGLPVPSARQLAGIRESLSARPDAEVVVGWPGAEARIYRQQLYLMPPMADVDAIDSGSVNAQSAFSFAGGELRLVPADDYGIPDQWARSGLDIRFRHGGERFRPRGSSHRKQLKQWFQEAGIVPWMRSSVPLLYHDDQLVAIADMCLVDGLPTGAGPYWQPSWKGHSRLR